MYIFFRTLGAPKSKRLVIFKNIEEDAADVTSFVYDLMTQSWSEGASFSDNASNKAISNFVVYKKNLSFWFETNNVIQNYSATPSGNQTIEYITKDIDFGAPSVQI